MARVIYDGKRIIPAPLVNIAKAYQKSGNGEIIGKVYSLTLTGTIVSWMGSPYSSGIFYTGSSYPADEVIANDDRLGAIQRKQEALRDLFSTEGLSFEVQSSIACTPVKCNPRLLEITFPEGIWYDRCEYTITLECDELYGGGFSQEDTFLQYISDASEEWTIDTNEGEAESLGIPRTYALSHTVSANGKRFYDDTGAIIKQPWQYARDFVLPKLGFDAAVALSSGVNNLPSYYQGFNHARNESIDKQGGSYSVTENWVLASGTASEDFTIQTVDSLDSPHKRVTVDGNIVGYEQRNANLGLTTSKWDNANAKFTQVEGLTFIRAQQFSGLSLNILPLTETIGRNPINGTISYNYEYDTRPMTLVSGVRSEVISIADNLGGQLYAEVFVLGRASRRLGPVLQDLNAKPKNTRSLSMELVFEPVVYTDRTYATIKSILNTQKPTNSPAYSGGIYNVISAANPLNNGFTTVFQGQAQESWNPKEGRFGYNTEWTFE